MGFIGGIRVIRGEIIFAFPRTAFGKRDRRPKGPMSGSSIFARIVAKRNPLQCSVMRETPQGPAHSATLNASRLPHWSSNRRRKLFSAGDQFFYFFSHQITKLAVSLFLIITVANSAPRK
jgi:hypothetical protein